MKFQNRNWNTFQLWAVKAHTWSEGGVTAVVLATLFTGSALGAFENLCQKYIGTMTADTSYRWIKCVTNVTKSTCIHMETICPTEPSTRPWAISVRLRNVVPKYDLDVINKRDEHSNSATIEFAKAAVPTTLTKSILEMWLKSSVHIRGAIFKVRK